jgi:hypothetical protein
MNPAEQVSESLPRLNSTDYHLKSTHEPDEPKLKGLQGTLPNKISELSKEMTLSRILFFPASIFK